MSIAESFEKFHYQLIVAVSCLIPDIKPRWYVNTLFPINKNCTASGVMLNLENSTEMQKIPAPLITFNLAMTKNTEGTMSINYMSDEYDECSEGKVTYIYIKVKRLTILFALVLHHHHIIEILIVFY